MDSYTTGIDAAAANVAAADSDDMVQAEIDDLRSELESERDLRLRLAAEYDNYRRRVGREQADMAAAGKRELLEQLIVLSDDLDLAVKNLSGSTDKVAEAVSLLQRQLTALLESNGVVGFESEGEVFDPERHEAFAVAGQTGSEPETVHQVFRKGYMWNGRLFRPALVVVAQ